MAVLFSLRLSWTEMFLADSLQQVNRIMISDGMHGNLGKPHCVLQTRSVGVFYKTMTNHNDQENTFTENLTALAQQWILCSEWVPS